MQDRSVISALASVSTVLTPTERIRVDAAGEGSYRALHRDNVDDVVRDLKAKGVKFDQDPTDMFYLWREARLRDPDGHQLRFYSDATDARLNPPWKISSAT